MWGGGAQGGNQAAKLLEQLQELVCRVREIPEAQTWLLTRHYDDLYGLG